MYITPFVAGVIATVFTEFAVLILAAYIRSCRKEKKHKQWHEDDCK